MYLLDSRMRWWPRVPRNCQLCYSRGCRGPRVCVWGGGLLLGCPTRVHQIRLAWLHDTACHPKQYMSLGSFYNPSISVPVEPVSPLPMALQPRCRRYAVTSGTVCIS